MKNDIENAAKFLAAILMELDWVQGVGYTNDKLVVYAKSEPDAAAKVMTHCQGYEIEIIVTGEIKPAI